MTGPPEACVIDDVYLLDPKLRGKPTQAVPYVSALLRNHIPTSDLKGDAVLATCEHFSSPQMTNPTYLTPAQRNALIGMLPTKDRRAGQCPTVGRAR